MAMTAEKVTKLGHDQVMHEVDVQQSFSWNVCKHKSMAMTLVSSAELRWTKPNVMSSVDTIHYFTRYADADQH